MCYNVLIFLQSGRECISELSLKESTNTILLEVDAKYLCLAAAAALLKYVEFVQKSTIEQAVEPHTLLLPKAPHPHSLTLLQFLSFLINSNPAHTQYIY